MTCGPLEEHDNTEARGFGKSTSVSVFQCISALIIVRCTYSFYDGNDDGDDIIIVIVFLSSLSSSSSDDRFRLRRVSSNTWIPPQ